MTDNTKATYAVSNHIATITLNDPKSLNALGTELSIDMLAAIDQAEADDSVRVIILQGSHGNFSSGGHIKEMLSVGMEPEALSAKLEAMVAGAGEISRRIRGLEKPIIAKLQGAVAGAGFNLALSCDFRVASEDAKFIQSFIHIGLIPDAGGIYLLSKLIGSSKATEFAMLGDTVTAQQAADLNLLYKVVPLEQLDETAEKLAARLVQMPATALATIKQMTNQVAISGLSRALDMETQHQAMLAKTDDFKEGVTAFVEKRKPNYVK
ncbi:enoyl-CoA hydratase-related protein [Psychrobacter sp. HD31]|uniref:enoyl-CoA hydratase/isomerase family protein n=1 Tax=Psychrobacter sp. HD31 TaxID=3112003 RepID=UPI003DA5CD62